MEIIELLISSLIIFGGTFFIVHFTKKEMINRKKNIIQELNSAHVNENSFQKYAKFYGSIYPSDKDFNVKLNRIYTMIYNQKIMDIKKISKEASCELPECVLMIKYLKNKRLIDDLYIDTNNFKLIPCSKDDQTLLDKYKPYIYGSHTQIEDFVNLLPNPNSLPVEEHKKEILKELLYLDKKGLLNGVKIDDIDGIIVYYALEKRKTVYNMETVHCENCGALNDVELTGKVRCSYCDSIVMGSKTKEVEES